MRKLLNIIITILTAISCTNLDEVWAELREHEERIERLETECVRLNRNIEAIQIILEALKENDYITDIVKIMEDEVEVGYSITFAKSGTITIYHGADGADGADGTDGTAPKIGIRKAADGEYYWTAGDEWLTDESGEKIPAVVANDPDGKYITPSFRIAEGVWYISYDGSETWQVFGEISGWAVFKEVTYDDDYVYFTLYDGTNFSFQKQNSASSNSKYGLITQLSSFLTQHGGCYSNVYASLVNDKNYDTWVFTTDKDCVIYLTEEEKTCHKYFSISVILPNETKGKRYRYNADQDTIPMEDSPLEVPAGSTIHITVRFDILNWSVHTDYVKGGTDKHLLEAIRQNNLIIQHTKNSQGNQSLLIFKKCGNNDELFMGQSMVRSTGTNNVDCWRLGTMSIYKRTDNSFISHKDPLIISGEWECAVKEVGAKDFVGGSAHGDEIQTSMFCLLDGKSFDLSSNFLITGKNLEILRTSILNRCDTPGDNIMQHVVKYTITPEELTFDQTIEFLQEMRLEASYLAMCPIARKYTKWGWAEGQTDVLDISEPGHSRLPVKGNHAHYSLWGDNFSINVEYDCYEGYFPENFGFISPSSNPAYNKIYYNFVGTNTEVTVPIGHKVSTTCKVSYNYTK